MNESVQKLFRPEILAMHPYKSARSLQTVGRVFLDANESAWEPMPGLAVNRYPEPQPAAVVDALAKIYDTERERILVGRGADEAIDVIVRAFCRAGKDAILTFPPTYGMYEVAARIQGAQVIESKVSAETGFTVTVDQALAAWTPNVKVVFLCNPNNPTGNLTPTATIEALAEALIGKSILVIDEAYIEFASARSFVTKAKVFPNVIVLRTLSKAWALAGVRCGVGIGDRDVMAILQKVRSPYPIPVQTAQTVARILGPEGRARCKDRVRACLDQRATLVGRLKELACVREVFPTDANFVLVRVDSAQSFTEACLKDGIVVRDRSSDVGLENCVRISVGTREENDALIRAVEGVAR